MTVKTMDHTAYPKSLKAKSVSELLFIIKDAAETAAINPDGQNTGYYLDEVSYAAQELRSRQK